MTDISFSTYVLAVLASLMFLITCFTVIYDSKKD